MTTTVDVVGSITTAFLALESGITAITSRARQRFESREWHQLAADSVSRLGLHGEAADRCSNGLRSELGPTAADPDLWASLKTEFATFAEGRADSGIAKTFFNSVSRRVLLTDGADPVTQFVGDELEDLHDAAPSTKTFIFADDLSSLIVEIVESCSFRSPFRDLSEDAEQVAQRIGSEMSPGERLDSIEIADPVFYRGKGAYLVGRIHTDRRLIPLALALVHKKTGIRIDAVLLTENDISVLFSFAHSYFDVEVGHSHDLVAFINDLVPRKRRSELFISLGRVRHGKTELFRELHTTLSQTRDLFVEPPGKRGLVMAVFTLPGFEMVFKVIRDNIPVQKSLTPSQVMEKYRLVFRHDRAGRLVDSQYFERLQLPAARFEPALLSGLVSQCSRSVRLEGNLVSLDLAYLQRRVTPLDVYLKVTGPNRGRAAVIDYGNAIRDLAVTGIFPGDLLIKNFGVTRNDRVVFYDYDELTELSNLNFRELPDSDDPQDEMAATPWFPIGPDDVFPTEFRSFLGLEPDLMRTFLDHHSHLLDPTWWNRVQDRIVEGDIVSIYPYTQDLRL